MNFSDTDNETGSVQSPQVQRVSQNSCWEASWPVNYRHMAMHASAKSMGYMY